MLPVLPPILTGDHPLSGTWWPVAIVKLSREAARVRRLAVSRLARNDPDMVSPDNDRQFRTTGVRALSGPLTSGTRRRSVFQDVRSGKSRTRRVICSTASVGIDRMCTANLSLKNFC